MPADLEKEILIAQARILEEEQKKYAGSILNIKGYGKGYTKASIKTGSPGSRGGVRYIEIKFQGTRPDGKSAAEVAFLNEYGVGKGDHPRMAPRGFIQKSISAKENELDEIAADHFAKWVESQLEF